MNQPDWLVEIEQRWQFHDLFFKRSEIEPDQEHHDIGHILQAYKHLRKALERINEGACYTEENPEAKDNILFLIGDTARKALSFNPTEVSTQ